MHLTVISPDVKWWCGRGCWLDTSYWHWSWSHSSYNICLHLWTQGLTLHMYVKLSWGWLFIKTNLVSNKIASCNTSLTLTYLSTILTASILIFLLLKLQKSVGFVRGAIVVSILILFIWLERHSGCGLNLSQFPFILLCLVSWFVMIFNFFAGSGLGWRVLFSNLPLPESLYFLCP